MTNPKVSIIMSTYNRAHIVDKAINSVLRQTYTDFEFIIIDDGSNDNTEEKILSYTDERIHFIKKKGNEGLSAGRNTGIANARGELIAFIDDDDNYLPDKLALQADFMEKNPHIGWLSGGYNIISTGGTLLKESRPWLTHPDLSLKTWLFWCPTCPAAVMVRRDWLNEVESFDAKVSPPDDWDLWLRLAHSGCPMSWVPQIICNYQIHMGNMTRDSNALHSDSGTLRVLNKFFSQGELPVNILCLEGSAYAHAYLKLATAAIRSGDFDTAYVDIKHAFQRQPNLQSDEILSLLLGYSQSPMVETPLKYANDTLELVSRFFPVSVQQKKRLLGQVAAGMFFSAARIDDRSKVKTAFWNIVRHDTSHLWNFGVWSTIGKATLGIPLQGRA